MAPKKGTKNVKKKLTNNTLRQYFPSLLIKYNQRIDQLPRENILNDENLMSVFRIMWNTNLLLKNMMDINAVSEARNDNISCVNMETILKELHKIIWKLKYNQILNPLN